MFYSRIVATIIILTIRNKCAVEGFFVDQHESIVVIPKLGRITGSMRQYEDYPGSLYYQYKGIPFADPVGRFNLAKAKSPWLGTLNCKIEGKVCPQPIGNVFYPGQLDEKNCLSLTVTTPSVLVLLATFVGRVIVQTRERFASSRRERPVMGGQVWCWSMTGMGNSTLTIIHHKTLHLVYGDPNSNIKQTLPVLVFFFGGAFIIGTTHTNWYNPERLVHEGIIVVQINYRLGAMGWLSDGVRIPKNIGLQDGRLALEWVHDNIAIFGGDPTQVTIYGQSAGAIMCDAFWQSERMQHLFKAVFLQSGTLINPHSVQKKPEEAFQKTILNSPCRYTIGSPVSEQIDCLQKLPDLLLVYSSAFSYIWFDTLQFGSVHGLIASVVVENATDPAAIVTMNPLERLQKGYIARDKPIMISITSEERITFEFLRSSLKGKTNEALVPFGMNVMDANGIGSTIKSYYGGSEAGFENLPNTALIRVSSDLLYNNGFRRFIDLVQPHLNDSIGLYCMQFSYASKLGLLNFAGQVGHVDDLFYIWTLQAVNSNGFRKLLIPSAAYEKRKQMIKIIGNFVKYGSPPPFPEPILENIVWPKVNNLNSINCIDFNTQLSIIENPKNENYRFWMDLYEKGHPAISL